MCSDAATPHPQDRLRRELSLADATFLVVASVIGAGIFITPGRVAELLPNAGWIFGAWAMGALLSLAGALVNAELGAMFPRAGGDYVYLREGVHPVAGFLVGWLSFFAIYAGTIATLAAALGEGIGERLGLPEEGRLGLALAVLLAISAINYAGVRWGARANNLTAALKLLALFAFVVLGPIAGEGSFARVLGAAGEGGGEAAGSPSLVALGRAMSPVLFTYLGWNASVYVASEIRDPARNLPRSLFLGLALCALVYLLVNAVYLYALPLASLREVTDAGEAAAQALFGPLGGSLVGGFVLLSILGTLNAMVLIGPRVAYAMALDGLFFRGVERVSEPYRTPGLAIVVQAAVAGAVLVLFGSFSRALDFTTFAILLATMADVVALYRLRRGQPARARPYRAWGYPLVPGLYLLASGGVAAALFLGSPFECLVSLGMVAAGLPFYFLFVSRGR